jgi:mannose-6-phosphate isomerase-like protein (cupin superfamily)
MNNESVAGLPGGQPVLVAASDGAVVADPAGQHVTVKIAGTARRSAYSLIEYSHAPGAPGPPAHLHLDHEEAFYVIDGELTLAIGEFGESPVTVRRGQAAVVPCGVIHRPGNLSGRPVRFVLITSPAMDGFFTELGRLVERSGGQPDASELRQLGDRYDTIFAAVPTGTAGRRSKQP